MASKKQGRIKSSASQHSYNAGMRWEKNKRRRVDREEKRQAFCLAIQSAAGTHAGAKKRVRDVSRRIRWMRAA